MAMPKYHVVIVEVTEKTTTVEVEAPDTYYATQLVDQAVKTQTVKELKPVSVYISTPEVRSISAHLAGERK
jgi:hypothetical protein